MQQQLSTSRPFIIALNVFYEVIMKTLTIGERIKERRKELGLSVDELAERLNKNRATIYTRRV